MIYNFLKEQHKSFRWFINGMIILGLIWVVNTWLNDEDKPGKELELELHLAMLLKCNLIIRDHDIYDLDSWPKKNLPSKKNRSTTVDTFKIFYPQKNFQYKDPLQIVTIVRTSTSSSKKETYKGYRASKGGGVVLRDITPELKDGVTYTYPNTQLFNIRKHHNFQGTYGIYYYDYDTGKPYIRRTLMICYPSDIHNSS